MRRGIINDVGTTYSAGMSNANALDLQNLDSKLRDLTQHVKQVLAKLNNKLGSEGTIQREIRQRNKWSKF